MTDVTIDRRGSDGHAHKGLQAFLSIIGIAHKKLADRHHGSR